MKAAVVVVHARDRIARPGAPLGPRPRVDEDVLDRVCNPTRFLSSAVRKLARRKCEGSVGLQRDPFCQSREVPALVSNSRGIFCMHSSVSGWPLGQSRY